MKKIIHILFALILSTAIISSCSLKRDVPAYGMKVYFMPSPLLGPLYLTLFDNHIYVEDWVDGKQCTLGIWEKKNDTLFLNPQDTYDAEFNHYWDLTAEPLDPPDIQSLFIDYGDSLTGTTDYKIKPDSSTMTIENDTCHFDPDKVREVYYRLKHL